MVYTAGSRFSAAWVDAGSGSATKRNCIQAPARTGNLLRCVAQFEAPAVLFQDAADDGEPKAGALLARRDIGLEQTGAVFLRQADAVVDHVDDDVLAVARRADDDAAAAEFGRPARRRSLRSRS